MCGSGVRRCKSGLVRNVHSRPARCGYSVATKAAAQRIRLRSAYRAQVLQKITLDFLLSLSAKNSLGLKRHLHSLTTRTDYLNVRLEHLA